MLGKFIGALGFFLTLWAPTLVYVIYPARAARRSTWAPWPRATWRIALLGALLPFGRYVRLGADEEPDRRGDPHLRDAHPDLLGRTARCPAVRPVEDRPHQLLQHLGPHGRVRPRHRGHAPARLLRLADGLLPVSRHRRPDLEEGDCRERPRHARRHRRGGDRARDGASGRRQLARHPALVARRLDEGAHLLALGDDAEGPDGPQVPDPRHGLHDAPVARSPTPVRSSCSSRYKAAAPRKIEVEYRRSGAQSRARRAARPGVRHPPEHGGLPLRRQEEVRRGGQARGLRLLGGPDGRRAGDQGVQRGAGLHVRDPRGHRDPAGQGLLHDGPRRGDARRRRARPRVLGSQAASRARQPDGRVVGLARQGRRSGRRDGGGGRGPADGVPRSGDRRAAEIPGRRRPRPVAPRSGPARRRAARRRTSAWERFSPPTA